MLWESREGGVVVGWLTLKVWAANLKLVLVGAFPLGERVWQREGMALDMDQAATDHKGKLPTQASQRHCSN